MRARVKAVWAVAGAVACALGGAGPATMNSRYTIDHGGVIRGDKGEKKIALIFTGGDFGEGADHILDVLKKEGIKAGMFVTGDYLHKAEHQAGLRRMVAEGHYLGPHSDKHLLYCPWEDREKTLVSERAFKDDLAKNIGELRALGALKGDGPVCFIPPYEWYNNDQARWSSEMGAVLFNFSPGSGSNRDYMPESEKRFVSSKKIMEDILAYEKKDPAGLNGYILLLHLGADRKDKMFLLLEPLIGELRGRGYSFVRIDELIRP